MHPHSNRPEYRAFFLVLLSMATGVIASLGAVVFRGLIALFHNLFFFGRLSLVYDANSHTPLSPWGPLVVLVPVIGGLAVVYLVRTYAPEAKGHGVPEVIDAIYYQRGAIRPVVAVIKSLASAISIGSGGSVGREGPIVQIGAAFGSGLAQRLRMPPWQTITLVASGAGAGIAATFNTPIGGLLFATEIVLHEVSVRTLVPVTLATATATYLGQVFFGVHPAFVIPDLETPYFQLVNPFILFSYAGLGLLLGVASALYIRTVYAFEDFFARIVAANDYLRHALGMLAVGGLCLLLQTTTGHYYVDGVGYATIQDILTGTLQGAGLMLLLCLLKLLATSLTLGSGGSGGIFSPALFLGATLGGSYGLLLHRLIPGFTISAPAFAIAGMAGVVGGATGAALTAIVMILEMTLDYNVVIPLTVTVAVSYGVRRLLCRENIYTLKLTRRGHRIPDTRTASPQGLQYARDLMARQFVTLVAGESLEKVAAVVSGNDAHWYLLEEGGELVGVLEREQLLAALCSRSPGDTLRQAATGRWVVVEPAASLHAIFTRMSRADAPVALVCEGAASPTAVMGVIGSREIAATLREAAELFAD